MTLIVAVLLGALARRPLVFDPLPLTRLQ